MTAAPAQRVSRGPRGRVGAGAWLVLGVLLAAPGVALSGLSPAVDWRVLVAVPLALSGFAFFAYRADKRRAEAGGWRIPEAVLQLAALLGGWPGAFLAQRWFRHKTAKVSFQIVFWLIVAIHQWVALDALLDWRMARAVGAVAPLGL